MSPTDALVMVLGSNLKPDCGNCQRKHQYHNLQDRLTAPTAIVCVETAVEEMEAVDASMAVAVVVLLKPDVDIVEVVEV